MRRRSGEQKFLELVLRVAPECGVTRICDISRLDRFGLDVIQVVRPWSRALSVHQGKGWSRTAALLSGVCEAIESHHAETFRRSDIVAPHHALSLASAPPMECFLNASASADAAGDVSISWVAAQTRDPARMILVPEDFVSLDFTRGLPGPFDRTSTGLSTGSTIEEAVYYGLLEIIERDAVGEWVRLSPVERMLAAVDLVPPPELAQRIEQLRHHDIETRLFRVPALLDTPTVICTIRDRTNMRSGYHRLFGSACHPDAAIAAAGALAEALQSRLTLIAGAREDIDAALYATLATNGEMAWPERPPIDIASVQGGVNDLAGLDVGLAGLGLGPVAWVDLTLPDIAVPVVKAILPGAGSHARPRLRPW
jgi:ribosomal protein S12 methylthiotransferase accessory factor